ncbi:MAG: PRC-barrel domain-containing protein [Acetobacteraceae bacterium]
MDDRTTAMGSDPSVAREETVSMIAADKVEGTTVYDTAGNKIASIYRVMLDKRKGTVAYAVMSFGGILGMGKGYYPIPWDELTYDTNLDGYVVSLSEAQLRSGPSYAQADDANWSDRAWTGRIDEYYGPGLGPRYAAGRRPPSA